MRNIHVNDDILYHLNSPDVAVQDPLHFTSLDGIMLCLVTIQYAIQYSTVPVQHSTVQYSTVQYSTVHRLIISCISYIAYIKI